jgi:hypothetical protein
MEVVDPYNADRTLRQEFCSLPKQEHIFGQQGIGGVSVWSDPAMLISAQPVQQRDQVHHPGSVTFQAEIEHRRSENLHCRYGHRYWIRTSGKST